jgi:hypothetical protein
LILFVRVRYSCTAPLTSRRGIAMPSSFVEFKVGMRHEALLHNLMCRTPSGVSVKSLRERSVDDAETLAIEAARAHAAVAAAAAAVSTTAVPPPLPPPPGGGGGGGRELSWDSVTSTREDSNASMGEVFAPSPVAAPHVPLSLNVRRGLHYDPSAPRPGEGGPGADVSV